MYRFQALEVQKKQKTITFENLEKRKINAHTKSYWDFPSQRFCHVCRFIFSCFSVVIHFHYEMQCNVEKNEMKWYTFFLVDGPFLFVKKMSAYFNVGLFTWFRLQVYDKKVQSTSVKGEKNVEIGWEREIEKERKKWFSSSVEFVNGLAGAFKKI